LCDLSKVPRLSGVMISGFTILHIIQQKERVRQSIKDKSISGSALAINELLLLLDDCDTLEEAHKAQSKKP